MKYWYMFPCGINEKSVGDAITDLFRQYYTDPQVQVTLYISSTGGDIDSAIRFYDFVKSINLDINTVGFGQVDSAAIILFLCGKERVAIKNCRFRLHAPTYNGFQQSQLLSTQLEMASLLKSLDDRYFDILNSELKMVKKVRDIYSSGKILTPDEALKLGIATKIESTLPVNR